MGHYQYQVTGGPVNSRFVKIINDLDEEVGCIEKDVLRKCEERYTYSLTQPDGSKITLGLKKRTFRDFNIAKYILVSEVSNTVLKEKAGKNLLLFRVKGKVDGRPVYIKEDEAGGMVVLSDGAPAAAVRENAADGISIITEDDVKDDSEIFGLTVLMFFMFKLYKREPWHIEGMLS